MWCLGPVILAREWNRRWESQRNVASGQVLYIYQAGDRESASADASGHVFYTFEAIDCRWGTTDSSGHVFSTYGAMNPSLVRGLLPLTSYIQIWPWSVWGSESLNTWQSAQSALYPTSYSHYPLCSSLLSLCCPHRSCQPCWHVDFHGIPLALRCHYQSTCVFPLPMV